VKVIADTNVLVRAAAMDDLVQSPKAAGLLAKSGTIIVTLPSLCEFVWVLRKHYAQKPDEIASMIRRLLAANKVQTDRAAVEAGLSFLEMNGDFADGVIAHIGARAGGDIFASFDKRAVKLVKQTGQKVWDLNADK